MMNRATRGLIDNVRLNRGRLVGHLYLGSTLTESVSRWPDNSPDNVGHRRAVWDLTCALLDRTLFADRRVINAIHQRTYIPLRADCSNPRDEMVKGFLREGGWAGNATMVIFSDPNKEDPVVLRVETARKLISVEDLINAMKR